LKCRLPASTRRKIVRCVAEQRRAANSTVTICVSAPQAAHHMSNVLLSCVRRTVRLCVSTVIRVVRFAKAHHPFCAWTLPKGATSTRMTAATDEVMVL